MNNTAPINTIYDVIESIRERPVMYLGIESVSMLRAYLDGFRHCNRTFSCLDSEQPPFDEFDAWIGNGYGWGGAVAFPRTVLAHANPESSNGEETGLTNFFEFLDVFRTRVSMIRAAATFKRNSQDRKDRSEALANGQTNSLQIVEYTYLASDKFREKHAGFSNFREFYVECRIGESFKPASRFETLEMALEHVIEYFENYQYAWTIHPDGTN